MNKPYDFLFDSAPVSIQKELPKNCLYPFATAQQCKYLKFTSASILRQRLNFRPFYVELFEINIQLPFRMTYQTSEGQHFLFFMLHGQIDFTDMEGVFISHAKEEHYTLTYNGPGLYRVKMQPGRHVALCVSVQPEWLAFVAKDLPFIKNYLSSLSDDSLSYAVLPYSHMDLHIKSWLRNIYSEISMGTGSLDGLLRLYISKTLERYNLLAEEKLHSLPYRVRSYLDAHFTDQKLNSIRVSRVFGKAERTLRNHFKSEFNITIRDYYTSCRIQRALALMQSKHLPVSDVFYEVGYNDESTFRYEMKKLKLRSL